MSKDHSEPAFPSMSHEYEPVLGLSIRDYFAANAMAACISNAPSCSRDIYRIGEHEWLKKQAGFAYFAADAMLAERAK